MRCWWHSWGPWQDVEIKNKVEAGIGGFPFATQTIKQQSRCSKCNRVKTHLS